MSASRGGGLGRGFGFLWLISMLLLATVKYTGSLSDSNTIWKMTHWLFDFEFGFAKRSLVGGIIELWLGDAQLTRELIAHLSIVALGGLLIALFFLFSKLFSKAPGLAMMVIAALVLTSPGVGHLISDLGRFDAINYMLGISVISCGIYTGRLHPSLFVGFSLITILIHEAALFTVVPLAFAVHVHLESAGGVRSIKQDVGRYVVMWLPALAMVSVVLKFGDVGVPMEELHHYLESKTDFLPSASSALVLVRDLSSNFVQTQSPIASRVVLESGVAIRVGPIKWEQFYSIAPMVLVDSIFFLVFCSAWCSERLRTLTMLIFVTLSPLPLFLVGVDWGRWVGLMGANCALLSWVFVSTRSFPADLIDWKMRVLVASAIVLFLVGIGLTYEIKGGHSYGLRDVLAWARQLGLIPI